MPAGSINPLTCSASEYLRQHGLGLSAYPGTGYDDMNSSIYFGGGFGYYSPSFYGGNPLVMLDVGQAYRERREKYGNTNKSRVDDISEEIKGFVDHMNAGNTDDALELYRKALKIMAGQPNYAGIDKDSLRKQLNQYIEAYLGGVTGKKASLKAFIEDKADSVFERHAGFHLKCNTKTEEDLRLEICNDKTWEDIFTPIKADLGEIWKGCKWGAIPAIAGGLLGKAALAFCFSNPAGWAAGAAVLIGAGISGYIGSKIPNLIKKDFCKTESDSLPPMPELPARPVIRDDIVPA